jgi:hypothetical protein
MFSSRFRISQVPNIYFCLGPEINMLWVKLYISLVLEVCPLSTAITKFHLTRIGLLQNERKTSSELMSRRGHSKSGLKMKVILMLWSFD